MEKTKQGKNIYIILVAFMLFIFVFYRNTFFYWKLYLLFILLVFIYFVFRQIIRTRAVSKNKSTKIKSFEDDSVVDKRIKEGDVVEIIRDSKNDFLAEGKNLLRGAVSAVNSGMVSVLIEGKIKIVELDHLKKITNSSIKFKELFFLGGSLLEQLQQFKQVTPKKERKIFFKRLSECVDFFKNGDFSDDYNEIREKFSEYDKMELYFSDLKSLISDGGIKLGRLRYSTFEIDLAKGLVFDAEGQKALIGSLDALKLIKNYFKID